jgi:hypothetical protein
MKKNIFSIFIIVILLFFTKNLFSQYWEKKNSPTNNNLYSMTFPNSDTGTVVGHYYYAGDYYPFELNTLNGGENFSYSIIAVYSLGPVKNIQTINQIVTYVIGWGVARRISGGSWDLLIHGANGAFFNDVSFPTSMLSFAAGYWYDYNIQDYAPIIFKTTDGWVNWQEISIASVTPYLTSIFCTDVNNCYCGADITGYSGSGGIFKSTNSGLSWTDVGFATPVFSLCFSSSSTGYAGTSSGLYKTTNAGLNWNFCYGTAKINGIYFKNMLGIAVGNGGVIYRTTDNGNTWQTDNSTVTQNLNDVYIVSAGRAYAVGNTGTILKYTNPDAIADHNSNTMDFYINPNPFSSKTEIGFTMKNPGYLQICITDMEGSIVIDNGRKYYNSGNNIIAIEGAGLLPDVYLCKITTDNLQRTLKLVKL